MKPQLQVVSIPQEQEHPYGNYLRDVFAEYVHRSECKRLLNQIAQAQERERFKSIILLSSFAGEGKSFLSMLLSFGFSTLMGKRVLLVDAVNQTQGRKLFLDRLMGFKHPSSRYAAELDDDEDGVGLIDLITTRSESSAVLESCDFQMGPYVNGLKSKYDLVLIDSCALESAGKFNMDPVVMSRYADRAIMVMTQKNMDAALMNRMKNQLERWGVKLLGTVYNAGLK